MAQQQKRKQKSQVRAVTEDDQLQPAAPNDELEQSTDATLELIEDALDEQLLADMDDVLERNAAEFVQQYVQEGGQ